MSPTFQMILWVLLAIAVIAGFSMLITSMRLKELRRQDQRSLQLKRQDLERERHEAQMALMALKVGTLTFDQNNRLVDLNEAARLLLDEIPDHLEAFCNRYAEELGTQFLLGKAEGTCKQLVKDRVLQFSLLREDAQGRALQGSLVLVNDVTLAHREEQQRKDFVANVSHELRTPLTTIETYSETLLDWGIEEKQREQLKKDVQRIYDNAQRMEKLIGDLLILSSIDGRGLATRVERLDFAWLVRQVAENLQTQAEAKQIQMRTVMVSQVTDIFGDRTSLERIMINLITNAIKYTPERGEISIYIGFLLEDVYVKVKDNGIGIDPDCQKHIFERFYRVDKTGSRQAGGTGLGLSIVKELVDLHQGQISVQSNLTQGAEFTVLLPSTVKTLKMAFYELTQSGVTQNMLTAAAERELEQLAEKLGIVAQWMGLNIQEKKTILRELDVLANETLPGRRPA